MKAALVNPPWTFEGSIYFGCSEPHLPLELGYARALLREAGVEALLVDAHGEGLSDAAAAARVAAFAPSFTVVSTAPTYLFWRCPPPELAVPKRFLQALGGAGGFTVAVGPHGSATPRATRAKLGCDLVIRGECEEAILELALAKDPQTVAGLYGGQAPLPAPRAVDLSALPALVWTGEELDRHRHHHHRFDAPQAGLGAEVEASRGCPYACTFCAKRDFRDSYRRRPLATLLAEIDGLIAAGVGYLYFIDEIFLPWPALLEALRARPVTFGVQTRLDLWGEEKIALLGAAGCVSIEAGVESLSAAGRAALAKECRLDTIAIERKLAFARVHVPFVQANLIAAPGDDPAEIAAFRARMLAVGVWANDPVPLFPYPSSPDYLRLFGPPDDQAWERAHAHYLSAFRAFSEIQTQAPAPLAELEGAA